MNKKISLVIPVHNEESGIKLFLDKQLIPEIKKISNVSFEIIIVNDGSTDKTLSILQKYAKSDKNIKILSFSRNFGKEVALAAGLQNIASDSMAAIMLDADGQHPPKNILKLIEKWESGSDIVVCIRKHYAKQGIIKKLGSKFFYKIFNSMSNSPIIPDATDFRLLDRTVVDEYNRLTEHNRITRGLIDWLGFEPSYVYYEHTERIAGKPSYNFKKLFRLAMDSFVSLSYTPLVIFGYIGIVITVLSFMLGLFVIIQQHIFGDPLQLCWNGAVQMAIFITFLVGLILVSQSITAVYISRIHADSQKRPLYVIDRKKSFNLDKDSKNK